MSRAAGPALPVIEFSASHVRVFDPATNASQTLPRGTTLNGVVSGRRAMLAISRRNTFIRGVRVPNASHGEIAQSLALQIGQLFPVSDVELAHTFKLTSDVNEEGRLAILAAVPVNTLRNAFDTLADNSVTLAQAVPVAFASPILAEESGLKHCAVVEKTTEGVAIDIVFGGELRTSRVVPEPRSDQDLEAEIVRSFAMAGVPEGPVLSTGGAQLRADRAVSATSLQALALPTGQRLPASLELPEIAAKRERQRTAARARLALLAIAGAAVSAYLFASNRIQAASAAQAANAQYTRRLSRLEAEQRTAESRAASEEARAKRIAVAFRPAQAPSDTLIALGNAAPKDVWVSGITFERGKPCLVRGTALRAESVAAYLDALTASARFRDVKLVFATNAVIDATPVVNFSLSAHAIGNLPVVEAKRRGSR
jgi:Tfp pilus assembly protein PilN